MGPLELNAGVLLGAFGVYAAVVVGLTLWNALQDRRASGRLDEAGPGGHIGHERGAQSLLDQVRGRHR